MYLSGNILHISANSPYEWNLPSINTAHSLAPDLTHSTAPLAPHISSAVIREPIESNPLSPFGSSPHPAPPLLYTHFLASGFILPLLALHLPAFPAFPLNPFSFSFPIMGRGFHPF